MKLILVVALAACAASPREPIEPPPLPDGVFSPDRTVGASELRMVADRDALWFAWTTGPDQARDLWLARTTLDGELEIEPQRVNDSPGAYQPAIALHADAIAIAYLSDLWVARTRIYDRSARPARPASTALSFPPGTEPWRLELVARATDGYRLVSATSDPTGETLVSDLDRDGDLTGANMRLGTNPAPMTSSPNTLGAATTSEDRTLIVWDRVYENCTGHIPYEAITASTTSIVQPLFDAAGQSEWEPAVAASGTSAYAAWRTDFELHSSISLARFDEPATILANVGDVTAFNRSPVLAMNGPGRGAIAWHVDEDFKLATFFDLGTSIVLGPVHTIQPVGDPARISFLTNTNLVSVGDDRFALGWVEHQHSGERNIYARIIDLAALPSPTPPRAHAARRERSRARPCIH